MFNGFFYRYRVIISAFGPLSGNNKLVSFVIFYVPSKRSFRIKNVEKSKQPSLALIDGNFTFEQIIRRVLYLEVIHFYHSYQNLLKWLCVCICQYMIQKVVSCSIQVTWLLPHSTFSQKPFDQLYIQNTQSLISAAFKLQRDFKPRLPWERCAPELMELIKILFGVLVHPHQKKYIEWWKCGPVASGKSYFKLFSLYISPSSS